MRFRNFPDLNFLDTQGARLETRGGGRHKAQEKSGTFRWYQESHYSLVHTIIYLQYP